MSDQRNYFFLVTRPVLRQYGLDTESKINLPATALVVRSKMPTATLPNLADVPFDATTGKVYTQQVTVNSAGTIYTIQVAGYYSISVSTPDATNLILGLRKIDALGASSVIGTNTTDTEYLHTVQYFAAGESFAVFQSGAITANVSNANKAWLEVSYFTKNTL